MTSIPIHQLRYLATLTVDPYEAVRPPRTALSEDDRHGYYDLQATCMDNPDGCTSRRKKTACITFFPFAQRSTVRGTRLRRSTSASQTQDASPASAMHLSARTPTLETGVENQADKEQLRLWVPRLS
ncbi:unnamed protein product [Cyclocybe aegerita]|uniref:Uncharacterized protein n=1 Tax=Cyclocybe aegerita TaxID=1973307 RepID=A0A8S0WNF0_CYCAE|nr:unnamed protein product [Cyclocybe aegerita]